MPKYLPNNPTLTPNVHLDVLLYIDEHMLDIIRYTTDTLGPLHIVFPHIVSERIQTVLDVYEIHGTPVQLYAAHKPTRSTALMQAVFEKNVNVDVASLGELEHVLSIGWEGKHIECTGSKHPLFLQKAIHVGALISIDSIHELEEIIRLSNNNPVRILIRVANPECYDRHKIARISRFGICKQRIREIVYPMLQDHPNIVCDGFHIHNDEREADVNAGYIFDILDMIQEAYTYGFSPTILNMGGGMRDIELADSAQWQEYIEVLESQLMNGEKLSTWGQQTFGLYINEKKRISGREKVQGKFLERSIVETVREQFSTRHPLHKQTLKDMIEESFLTVMIEPGYTLFNRAGCTAMTVIAVEQQSDGTSRVVVDGNMYDLSIQMREQFVDPVLLSTEALDMSQTSWQGYIVGNLCREEDVLMKRQVEFSKQPVPSDVILFYNTSAYSSSFESSETHMHKKSKELVVQKNDNTYISKITI